MKIWLCLAQGGASRAPPLQNLSGKLLNSLYSFIIFFLLVFYRLLGEAAAHLSGSPARSHPSHCRCTSQAWSCHQCKHCPCTLLAPQLGEFPRHKTTLVRPALSLTKKSLKESNSLLPAHARPAALQPGCMHMALGMSHAWSGSIAAELGRQKGQLEADNTSRGDAQCQGCKSSFGLRPL